MSHVLDHLEVIAGELQEIVEELLNESKDTEPVPEVSSYRLDMPELITLTPEDRNSIERLVAGQNISNDGMSMYESRLFESGYGLDDEDLDGWAHDGEVIGFQNLPPAVQRALVVRWMIQQTIKE